MDSYDCIIIGSGLGGLTAGALLSKRGKKVLVIEQHNVPGGCATTFERKGCSFEVGLHKMDGLDDMDIKSKIFRELDVFNNVQFIHSSEFYRFVSGDYSMVMPDNYVEAIKKLGEQYPSEKRGIKKFITTIVNTRDQINKLCRYSPMMQQLLFPLYPFMFPAIILNMNKSLWSLLRSCIKNPKLRVSMIANLLYYHNDPKTMSVLYFSAAQGSYLKGGGHYIKGGSKELSNYLAGFIEKNGGLLLYKHLVTKIITKNGKAIGVEYTPKNSDNELPQQVFAGNIIANTAVPNVANNLLEGKNSIKLKKKIQSLENSISALTIYMVFNKPPSEFGNKHFSTFIMNPGDFSSENIKYAHCAGFSDRIFAFCDYSRFDAGLTPKGKYFAVICSPDYLKDWENLPMEEYKAKKEEVIKVYLNRLEKVYPGITSSLEYFELATAKTVKRYILTPGGAIYGYAQTVKQAVPRRLSNKSPIKNLYFASSWVFPGGGFTGAIISGNNCANYIR